MGEVEPRTKMARPRLKLVRWPVSFQMDLDQLLCARTAAAVSDRGINTRGNKSLTGAIAVRVRPPLKPTDPGFELIPQRFQRSMVHVTASTSLAVDVPQGRKLFVFDRVFPETVDQDGVWDYLSDSVNSFTQGYNVSILAYGQSGAGKSYTMGTSGPSEQNNSQAMG